MSASMIQSYIEILLIADERRVSASIVGFPPLTELLPQIRLLLDQSTQGGSLHKHFRSCCTALQCARTRPHDGVWSRILIYID